jgi:GNAT superfamily N-acetyltransferase
VIRPASIADVPALVELIRELAEFERARDQVEIDESLLERALFGPEPSAFALVASSGEVVVAMALYYRSFSTWTGHPGLGVGKALLASLARRAIDEGCRRLEWSVLDWNEPAIEFYKSIGAVATDDWTRYRLSGSVLRDFAGYEDGREQRPPVPS